jgi:hypothetical protein
MAETPKEKTDRQLIELLNELRVALPGAQVLLGFLLTAPFASRFGRTSQLDRIVFFMCAIATAAGIVLLMAPSVYHRIRWSEGGKGDVIRAGHHLFLVGTGCVAFGIVCAVFVVGDVLFGGVAAGLATGFTVAIILFTWYVLPLERARHPSIRGEE